MREFRETMYPFGSIETHIKHIAQMKARGIMKYDFVEGYGYLREMGIKVSIIDQEEEIE